LELLEAALGSSSGALDGEDPMSSLWLPGSFVNPEDDRIKTPDLRPGPAKELFDSSIKRLRDEAARIARGEDLFGG
jgi:hypothetical protein